MHTVPTTKHFLLQPGAFQYMLSALGPYLASYGLAIYGRSRVQAML